MARNDNQQKGSLPADRENSLPMDKESSLPAERNGAAGEGLPVLGALVQNGSGSAGRGQDAQINLTVINPDNDDDEIDLGRVFRNFKEKRRVYAWVLLLCLCAGICAGLLSYQFSKPALTVSSVVTLRYEGPDGRPVTNLTAPDGTELDLNQITSAYVLQNALSGLTLSKPVSLTSLRSAIKVSKILTEESRRQQELTSTMMENSNNSVVAEGYKQVQDLTLDYTNQFVVALTNGFGDEDADADKLVYLEDGELTLLLDRILASYNDYLLLTYSAVKLPDDEISVINIESLDVLESLDLLRAAMNNLETYCEELPNSIRGYRSWKTGIDIPTLETKISLAKEVTVDYLYSYVYSNSIVRDPVDMITQYNYQLRTAQSNLDAVNDNIATNAGILANYKNDEIYVSMQESDSARTTKTTTDYYNRLILSQTENYEAAADLEVKITDLQEKINSLVENAGTDTSAVTDELENAVTTCRKVYQQVYDQMTEVMSSRNYTNMAEASVAQGKSENFISGASKNMLTFGAVGAVIALALWFMSALAPEFRRKRDEDDAKKEAAV